MVQRRTFQSPATVSEAAPEAIADAAGESGETGAPDVTLVPDSALAKAQQALASNDADIARLVEQRNALLVRDEVDYTEVERIDGELARHQRRQKTLTDRLSLLAAETQREAAEQAAQAREAKIIETERIFIERDAAVDDLKVHLERAEAAFRRVHELNLEARAGWEWAHGRAGGTMTAASDLVRETASFLYKIGGRPAPLGGQFPPNVPPAFPGAKCPKIELLQSPARLPDLAAEYRLASKYASDVMRGVRVDTAPASTASPGDARQSAPTDTGPLPQVSPLKATPDPELSKLLARQNALVNGPMDAAADRLYDELSAQIRALQSA
jgi:hypothetical protein